MAFVRIDKSNVGASYNGVIEVRMGSKLKDEHSPRGVYMSIASPIVKEVGWSFTDQGNDRRTLFVFINEGTGKDAGFWMIEQTNDKHGYVLGSSGKYAAFTMGVSANRLRHYVLNDHSVEPGPVDYTVDASNKSILIECPDWLRYNPLSEPREHVDPAVVQQAQAVMDKIKPNRAERRQLAKVMTRHMR